MTRDAAGTVRIILGMSLFLVAASCHHSPSGPDDTGLPFSLSIVAKDASGNGVPGLRVSAFYAPPPGLAKRSVPSLPTQTLASSAVTFDAPSVAVVDLTLHELTGALVQTLIDHRVLAPGKYMNVLSIRRNVGTRVYICRLAAVDTATAQTVFRDSIYITLWQPDAAIAVLGYTGGDGAFSTVDSLAFPHLLSLPPMIRTDFSPTSLGTFSFPDSVSFVLADTSTMGSATLVRRIVHGPNAFTIPWDPGPSGALRPVLAGQRAHASVTDSVIVLAPAAWKLYQNYPNPFN